MRLTDEELRAVLARAEEIQLKARHGHEMHAELEAVIAAGEEVGLTRPAMERALRERLNLPADLPAPGTLAFATSVDGNAYVAEVLSISSDSARVRYLRGGELVVSLDQLRPCYLIPGERVVCNWPWWGPWTCTVMAYDPMSQHVQLSDGWGSTHSCPLEEVWLAPPRNVSEAQSRRRRAWWLLGTGAGLGALIASIVTALLMQ